MLLIKTIWKKNKKKKKKKKKKKITNINYILLN